jgi:glyoxylase-like metal-dependent hydrolase (beta-lactamase superfamily II)
MRVLGVSTGVVRGKRRAHGPLRYLPGGWSEETLPVNVFAVEHPSGICLFDTGQTAAAARPGFLPRWHPYLRLARFELRPQDEAAARIDAEGLDPAAVRWVVLSHLHTDHVGGLAGFPRADVLVSAVEWSRASGVAGRLRGYVPRQWPAGRAPVQVRAGGPAVGPFAWSHDVAGDGSLLVVPTAGHTPGHVSLLVAGGTRSVLLAGDLVHDPAELAAVAPAIAEWCAEQDVLVLAAHDPRAVGRF